MNDNPNKTSTTPPPTIPSLKRAISGGNTRTSQFPLSSPTHPHHPPETRSLEPPAMLRAVTSAAAFNRSQPLHVSGKHPPARTTPAASTPTTRDWRTYLSIEERTAVRSKIQAAYSKTCPDYEALLQVVCAIEEELLHISAPSRLDYFKSGFEFEKRVKLKLEQLKGSIQNTETHAQENNNHSNQAYKKLRT